MYERTVKTKQEILREKEERKEKKRRQAIARATEKKAESVRRYQEKRRAEAKGKASHTRREPERIGSKTGRDVQSGLASIGSSDSAQTESRRRSNRPGSSRGKSCAVGRSSSYGDLVQKARNDARKRDSYTCQVSGRRAADGYEIDGAHLLPVRYAGGSYDPTDRDNVVSLWRVLHIDFDSNQTPESRAEWLRAHGLTAWADRLLEVAYYE